MTDGGSLRRVYRLIRKSDAAQIVIIFCVLIVGFHGAMYFVSFALNTEKPLLVVISGSMQPTLNVGDIIVVKGFDPNEIKVGDIIVYHKPIRYEELNVHRVIEVYRNDGKIFFTTKGDANSGSIPWEIRFPADLVVGKVIEKLPYPISPYLGIFLREMQKPDRILLVAALVIIYLGLDLYNSRRVRSEKEGGSQLAI